MNKVELWDSKLRFQIPEGFEELSKHEIAKYYTSSLKPDFLFENKSNGAFIAVAALERELTAEALQSRIQEYAAGYQRVVPNFANCQIAIRKINDDKVIGMFYYTSTTINRNLLNYVVLGCLDGKEVMMTLHCNIEDCPEYAEKLMRTVNSLEIFDAIG